MSTRAKALGAALCLALCGQAALAQDKPVRKSSLGMNAEQAGEMLLRDVCMAGKYDGKVIADQAKAQGALEQPAKFFNGGPADKAYRAGPIINAVYAVDWATGDCTTRVSKGDDQALRAMAERVILARPEGFVRGSHTVFGGGQAVRTVYCAFAGPDWLIASITSPGEKAAKGTPALSSTVYRARSKSPLCTATPTP